MMPELKPCPCGKPAGYVGGSSRLDGLLTASIECSKFCGFRVEKSELYKRKDHTPAEMTGFTLLLRHKAIKAWNSHSDGGDSLREALERIVVYMKQGAFAAALTEAETALAANNKGEIK